MVASSPLKITDVIRIHVSLDATYKCGVKMGYLLTVIIQTTDGYRCLKLIELMNAA